MSKKILSLLLAVVMVFTLGATAFAADVQYPVIKGDYTHCPSLGFLDFVGNVSLDFAYSDAYFTHTGYQYDHDLAKVSMALTQASFASASSSVEGWQTANSNFNALMKQCGFEKFAANEDAVSHPGLETLGACAASKTIVDNGGKYTLIALGLRGHNYGGEWYGNFDVGKTGGHAGFIKAAEKAMTFLKQYIKDNNITGRVKLWTTGFSRAAATANLLGARIDQGESLGEKVTITPHDLYCYTFETPQGAQDSHSKDPIYDNIYNIMNPNDFVPMVSFDAWDQSRYGQDLYTPAYQIDKDYASYKPGMTAELRKMGWMSILGIDIDLIDNFQYYDLNPINGAVSSKEVTQTEYYNMVIDALLTDMMSSRQDMADNVQADIQELSATLLGIDTGRLMNALVIFAGKFADPMTFVRFVNSLTITGALVNGTAVDQFVDLFMDALVEAGCANYNGDQVRAMLRNLAPRLLNFIAKNPTLAFNLVQNLVPIINAHFSEVTNAWLRCMPADYFANQARQLAYTGGYTDVYTADWYSDEVEYCTRGGFMNGMGGGIFAPDANTTRAEFAMVLYRLEGCPEGNLFDPFTDVIKGSWYQKAVAWAYQNGVVKGVSETIFEPNSNITREQMVAMLYRYANRVVATKTSAPLTAFGDASSVSNYAVAPMQWAVGTAVINGMGGNLVPQGFTTRAQIARVMQQFCEIKADMV
jgi:hypothetical protein